MRRGMRRANETPGHARRKPWWLIGLWQFKSFAYWLGLAWSGLDFGIWSLSCRWKEKIHLLSRLKPELRRTFTWICSGSRCDWSG